MTLVCAHVVCRPSGIAPHKPSPPMLKYVRDVIAPMDGGIVPCSPGFVKPYQLRYVTAVSPLKTSGTVP